MNITNLTKDEIIHLLETDSDIVVKQLYDLIGTWYKKNHIRPNDDLTQDLIILSLNSLNVFDSNKSKLSTFLFMKYKQYYIMRIRKNNAKYKKAVVIMSLDYTFDNDDDKNTDCIDTIPSDYYNPLEIIINAENNDKLDKLMQDISDVTRDYINGETQNVIAKRYNITQSAISRKIKRELNRVRSKL